MEDYGVMRKLVGLVFGKNDTIDEEILIARKSPIPAFLLTEDFSKAIKDVLCVSQLVATYKWKGFLDANSRNMLSSHMNYMIFVMAACLSEYKSNQNVFNSFISVCSLIITLNEEILEKTGVDFSDLNPDIFMVFYRNVMKRSFHRRRDFLRFGEYVRGHKYIEWIIKGLALATDPTNKKEGFVKSITENLNKSLEVANDIHFTIDETGISLGQEVLSTTSVELPTLPNESDLIRRLVESRKRGKARIAERGEIKAALTTKTSNVASHVPSCSNSDSKTNYVEKHKDNKKTNKKTRIETDSTLETLNVTSHGNSNSSSDSKTIFDTKHQENIAQYENIIQAVIRHNHSKLSGQEKMENQIHEETEGILKSLKNTIKSLIKVLDKCDKE